MASLTGILLVIAAVVMSFRPQATQGLPVAIASRSAYPPGVACAIQRVVIVRVQAGGHLFLNAEQVTISTLPNRLEAIFRTRADRVAFVDGSPNLEYATVAAVISAMTSVIDTVGILTPNTVPTPREPLLKLAKR